VIWRERKHNKEADYLANYAMDYCQDFRYEGFRNTNVNMDELCVMGWSDGGFRYQGVAGGGWVVKAWQADELEPQILYAAASFYQDESVDSYMAETFAMNELIQSIKRLILHTPNSAPG